MKKSFRLLAFVPIVLSALSASSIEQIDGVYQIGSSADMLEFANKVNNGEVAASALLTADIDFSGENIIIATNGDYEGTFDGGGHKLTVNIDHQSDGTGLFSHIAAKGKVCNLIVDGTISGTTGIGTFAWESWGTIENCVSLATIISNHSGFSSNTGISCACYGGSVFRNCIFAGKIIAPQASGIAGISIWTNATATMENCVVAPAELNIAEGDNYTLCRWPERINIKNCYYTPVAVGSVQPNTTEISTESLASGELCFRLNGDQSVIAWRQNIGEDAYPYPFGEHAQVYATGVDCGGNPLAEATYSNTFSQISKHSYDGFQCSVCGKLNIDYCSQTDGWYEIDTADKLEWFAYMVNNGYNEINVRLTADIDYSGRTSMIGVKNQFRGVFDGQYHKVTVGFDRNDENTALFCQVGRAGKVCNLSVDGTINTSARSAAGICALLYGTIENCVSLVTINTTVMGEGNHGGIASQTYMDATIRNCIFAGSMLGAETNGCGGLIGTIVINPAYVYNCVVAPKKMTVSIDGSNTFSRRANYLQMENSFYVEPFGGVADGAIQKNEDALASGEMCYQLNGEQQDINWYQTLGEDPIPYPFPSHKQVFAEGVNCSGVNLGSAEYSNDHIGDIPAHQFSGFTCNVCGKTNKDYTCEMVDGQYIIKNLGDFQWFAYQLNNGNLNINAKLDTDIDYSEDNTRIAYNGAYQGTLDGCGHTITVGFHRTADGTALFDRLGANGKICNLIVDGTLTGTTGMGTFAWETWGTIENCVSLATIITTQSGKAVNGGIVCASYAGSVFRNCVFAGSMIGPNATGVAGVIGWANSRPAILENCIVAPVEMSIGTAESHTFVCPTSNADYTNCYYVEPFAGVPNSGCTQVNREVLASGKFCFQLNNEETENPQWYQNIGEDAVPYPITTHGVVYSLDEETYMDVHDDNSMREFRNALIEKEFGVLNDAIVKPEIANEYETYVNALNDADNREDFDAAYKQWLKARIIFYGNVNAYAAYIDLAEKIKTYLNENTLTGENSEVLKRYVNGDDQPNELFPNGGYKYVMSEKNLDTQMITSETSFLEELYDKAVLSGYVAGTDVTKLITNADFSRQGQGWEGQLPTSFDSKALVAEYKNATGDMHQTLQGLKNGVYVVSMNAFFCPAGHNDSRFYSSYLYANEVSVPVMTIGEDPVSFEDAIDMENCYVAENAGTYPYDDVYEDMSFVPSSTTGARYAFNAGRYMNKLLVNVTDGTLTVGVRAEGTDNANDWTVLDGMHLYYCGDFDLAGNAASEVASGYAKRVEALRGAPVSSGTDCSVYPNCNAEILNKLSKESSVAQNASSASESYKSLLMMSSLFKDVKNCQKGYIHALNVADDCLPYISEVNTWKGYSDEVYNAFTSKIDALVGAYEEGKMTAEEAWNWNLDTYTGTIAEDGTYLIANTGEMTQFAVLTNSGKTSVNGRLLSDIDFSSVNIIMGAKGDYQGTFDGSGHKLTVGIDHQSDGTGLFSHIGAKGKVCNLIVDGTISGTTGIGTFAWESWGTIENCVSLVTITSSVSGFSSNTGLSCACHGGSVFRNCIFAGKIIAPQASGIAGISIWTNATSTMENCVVAPAELNIAEGDNYTLCRWPERIKIKNCYYTPVAVGSVQPNSTETSVESLASGELCFRLNGDQSVIAWRQNIGEDAYPYPFGEHAQVYATGVDCGGRALEGTSYSNTYSPIPAHSYDGFQCSVCGRANLDYCSQPDGWYEIDTVDKLEWFDYVVNNGYPDTKVRLTADIDFSGKNIIFATKSDYQGIFDGCGHKLTVGIDHQSDGTGLFSHIGAKGKVCNLIVDGTISGTTGIGTFAWESWGTIENCVSLVTITSSVSGFSSNTGISCACYGGSVFRNCIFAGRIIAPQASGIAGISIWVQSPVVTMENCVVAPAEMNIAEGDNYTFCRWPDRINIRNCYYTPVTVGSVQPNTTETSVESLASGELCYNLNGDQSVISWYQNLGEDSIPYPFATHSVVVLNGDGTYGNLTAIRQISDSVNETIYDLSGRRVNKMTKGIYIVNGKKIMK